MTQLTAIAQAIKTMSSREIAELTGKEHKNVTRDIEKMLLELGEDVLNFERIYFDSMNRSQTELHLDRELTDTLLTGYSAVMRRKVIARWRELEGGQVAAPVAALPQDYIEALEALVLTKKSERRALAQVQQQQAALALAAPKVAFVERYVESTGLKGFREVCKLLKANESRFREFLIDSRIMYRLGGVLTAHQPHIDAKRFAVTTGTSDVSGHAYTSARFTPKGIEWVAGEWAKHCLRQEVAA